MAAVDPTVAEEWMALALEEARLAGQADEVPVGAVVVEVGTGKVLGRGRDRKVELCDPTAHAEVLAMREAALAIGDWRLEGCALVVTLEPCPMCAGTAILARIPLLVFGAMNPKFGAVGSLVDLPGGTRWNHHVEVIRGVMEVECGGLLKQYFRARRAKK